MKEKIIMPTAPDLLQVPNEPIKPNEFDYVFDNSVALNGNFDNRTEIELDEIIELSQKYKKENDKVSLVIFSESDPYGDYPGSNIESVNLYFYKRKNNKNYDKEFKKYNVALEKYNKEMQEFAEKEKIYNKEMEVYQQKYDLWQLEMLKIAKEDIEKKISKIEKKK
jgi:hypothetical protein